MHYYAYIIYTSPCVYISVLEILVNNEAIFIMTERLVLVIYIMKIIYKFTKV